MTFERWLTFKVCSRMTENGVFHLPLNFSQKWRKQRVEALKISEIECLGFTERALLIAYFSSFFPLFKNILNIVVLHFENSKIKTKGKKDEK